MSSKDVSAAINCSAEGQATKRVSVRPEVPRIDLTLPGRLRADDVQAILRIGRSFFYQGIKDGKYPQPDFREGSISFWKNSTLLKFLNGGVE
ncbi:helix-turn-helix transcriptional regulator [Paraburkholderia sediminicola]|uniref:helix-turn-helix transcriptional regulator n=1 Tax=Paraburkholderia sediminicola TaxID=458836 RepID=UPI0038BBCFDE